MKQQEQINPTNCQRTECKKQQKKQIQSYVPRKTTPPPTTPPPPPFEALSIKRLSRQISSFEQSRLSPAPNTQKQSHTQRKKQIEELKDPSEFVPHARTVLWVSTNQRTTRGGWLPNDISEIQTHPQITVNAIISMKKSSQSYPT